jgi:hypothetical protein
VRGARMEADAADEGLTEAYMLRVTSWALSGPNVSGPDGAPRVKFKIRPKPAVFRVSKPENPWAENRHQNRNPQTRNP